MSPSPTPSPRYVAAHMALPALLQSLGPKRVLDAIEVNDAELFAFLWTKCGFHFRPRFFHTTYGVHRLGVMTFPEPRDIAEAYMGLVVGRTDSPAYYQYFTWEMALDLAGGPEPATLLGTWTSRTHTNLGEGPALTGDLMKDAWAFAQAALKHLQAA
ncbi:hypothetical protein LZC95_29545 [Pendulispora brunnea]|uniref:Uncharacterized protein n=1 Tax=Pendulispora brunnea TaxID=2905690 RepID=A0ABZ2JXT4_9BACT